MMKALMTAWTPVFPETTLLLFVLAAVISGVYRGRTAVNRSVSTGFVAAFLVLTTLNVPSRGLFVEGRDFVVDGFAVYFKKMILAGSLLVFAFGINWLKYKKFSRIEYGVLLAFSVIGMMATVSADNFLTQFLGLETMQLPLLFLTAYKRKGERSTEAGTKLTVTTLLGSGLYLFGVSVVYACLGTTDFSEIATANKQSVLPVLSWGVSFVCAGLFLKLGVAPFHAWVSDVYEGAPSPVTAFFGIVVRLPILAAIARVVTEPFADLEFFWKPVLIAVSVLSLGVGSFGALVQKNVKRLSGYAIVALNGMTLSALAVKAFPSFLFLTTIDTLLICGLFGIVLSLRIGDELCEDLAVLDGQGREKVVRGGLFSLIFFGISGMPPFAGFWSRLFLFEKIIHAGLLWFAIVLMTIQLLLMFVCLKQIRRMFFVPLKEEILPAALPMKIAIEIAAVSSVALMFPVDFLWRAINAATMALG